MHMKDTIDKLMLDFNKFCQENTNFTDKYGLHLTLLMAREKATSLNDMRDMLATLPQFQEMRDQFSLHLNMAEKCMELFEEKKLLSIGLIEQVPPLPHRELTNRVVLQEQLLKARYRKPS